MPRTLLRVIPLFVLALPGRASAQAATEIASIGWLAGCLEQRSSNRLVEEQRMGLQAGTMLGMGRTSSAKGLGEYELTLIKQDGPRLLYEAHPSAQPPATFAATVANGDSVVFSAPEHDFPQQVGYRRVGRDSVVGWIAGAMRGSTRRIEFPYRRVACPTAP